VVIPRDTSGQERRRARRNPAPPRRQPPQGPHCEARIFKRSFLQSKGIYVISKTFPGTSW
jgi:hypothetical protein